MMDYSLCVNELSAPVREYVVKKASLCQPDSIHICDGSESENAMMIDIMLSQGD